MKITHKLYTYTSMFYKGFYSRKSDQEIKQSIEKEGFNPIIITDEAGYIYQPHSHPETKLLAFLTGSMTLKVQDTIFECLPGDKVIIPGTVPHSAIIGPKGCTFFWSEKLL